MKLFSDESVQEADSQSGSNSDEDEEEEERKEESPSKQENNASTYSNDNDSRKKKPNSTKITKNSSPSQQEQAQKNASIKPSKASTLKSPNRRLQIEMSALPNPANFHSYACPLNVILFHIGHSHRHNHNYHNYPHIYSYHNNYYHQNHYHHLNNLSRGGIALMLLSELLSTDGADFDWTPYLPFLFHYCLINFDNTKPIIGEHAKKLFLNILYILTVQNELYTLTDFLIESMDSIIDNQSIIYDRKYTTNNLLESASSLFSNAYSHGSSVRLSPGNCHYNYNFNFRAFSSQHLKGFANNTNVGLIKSVSHRALINMHSAPSSPANQNNKNNSNSGENAVSPQNTDLLAKDSSNKKSSLTMGKRCNKLQKAKDHLAILLNILARCKNSPVWPYELITCQNHSKQLTSVQIINEFVSNLQAFLQLCFSTKQVIV